MGNVYNDYSNYNLALDYYYLALEIERDEREIASEVLTLYNISIIHIEQEDFDQAESKLRRAIELSLMEDDDSFLGSSYNSLTEVLLLKKKITEASINLGLAFNYLEYD